MDAFQASLAYMAKALPQKQQTKTPLMYFSEAVEEEMAWSERCRRGDNVERDGRGRGRKRGGTQLRGSCRRLKVQFITLFPGDV